MIYHILAFAAGFILDLIIGDPYSIPHPIRLIGSGIAWLEKKMNREEQSAATKRRNGALTVIIMCTASVMITGSILVTAYFIHPVLGIILETIMTWQILATKSLKDESMKVYKALETGTIDEARYAVSMIVGRDTQCLDDKGVARAATETVAENTSDGVIAPMLYTALGGPVLGFLYKTINTMDSMIAYKNDRYIDFGRAAARTDDVVNFIPARISGILIIMSCMFLGKEYDMKNAYRIFKRDRFNHASPNSAQTEAAVAGALNIRLAGPASYFGKTIDKKYIGDDNRLIENKDIRRANRLLYVVAVMAELICIAVMLAFKFILDFFYNFL